MAIKGKYSEQRAEGHDKVAVPLVHAQFEMHGFSTYGSGWECQKPRYERALEVLRGDPGEDEYERYAPLAPYIDWLRLAPDRFVWNRDIGRRYLVEVKTKVPKYKNYAMDVDEYKHYRLLDELPYLAYPFRVLMTFVPLNESGRPFIDPGDGEPVIDCCWAKELPKKPNKIYVPRCDDFDQQWARMKREWPGVPLLDSEWVLSPRFSGHSADDNHAATSAANACRTAVGVRWPCRPISHSWL